ncbi:MAG: hypothetical protein M0Z41_09785 [Peptococcaceae bacterium]|nr:hypothetical protein [Peptococcaceae bacterium]
MPVYRFNPVWQQKRRQDKGKYFCLAGGHLVRSAIAPGFVAMMKDQRHPETGWNKGGGWAPATGTVAGQPSCSVRPFGRTNLLVNGFADK